MTIGIALGNALAGYRDHDNDRCATGLVAIIAEVKKLREAEAELLRAISLAIHEMHHPERALEVLKAARDAAVVRE